MELRSLADTRQLAQQLAGQLPQGAIVLLTGPLGVGKTSLVQQLARCLGFEGEVTFGVDRAYGAILEAKVRSSDGRPLRSLAVEDFAKAGDQWVLGTCSVRDEASRDTDLLKFTEAAIGLRLGDDVFTEASLARPAEKPAGFRPL